MATIFGMAVVVLMRLSSSFDRWVDDATVYLELLFGISGVVLCAVLAPVVWWLEHSPDLPKTRRIGGITVSILTLAPYFLIAGILLFYRE